LTSRREAGTVSKGLKEEPGLPLKMAGNLRLVIKPRDVDAREGGVKGCGRQGCRIISVKSKKRRTS